jgi:four helix bundle protein
MQKELIENNPILKQSIEFSLLAIDYCEVLNAQHKFVISKQLLRSATSIGANAMEAQNAESKADFIHKMKIAAKEADETQYWLTLCSYSKQYPDCDALFSKLETVQKILNAILGTAKRKTPISYFFSFLIF